MTGVNSVTRIPALDGIRGIAILAVLAGHGYLKADWAAIGGVTLFFVLSGYLITGRLLSGQTLRRFYANRARRILPASTVMLAVTGAFFLPLNLELLPQWLYSTFYVMNIASGHSDLPWSPWAHMWSLSMEEQFYLLWPLAFVTVARRQRLIVVVGVLSFTAMLIALATGHPWLARFSPLTMAWPLCLGCWLALRGWAPSWPGWLSWSPLTWFGVRSYGIYLWHYPFAYAGLLTYGVTGRWVGIALGVGVAVLSWRYVESPWLSRTVAPTSTPRARTLPQRSTTTS